MFRSCGLAAFAFLIGTLPARAADPQQTGWAAWFNNWKFNEQIGLVSDLQLRSQDEWAGPRNLLVRPGVSWYVAPGHTLSAGYAYIGTFNRDARDAVEHRGWQQYLASYRLGALNVSQRLRLEQRFIDRPGAPDVYADRFRWFTRMQLPLSAAAPFVNGAFLALQNEAMVNLSHRDDLNGKVFDQNRAYVALGWRLNPTTDVEIGYLNQWLNGRDRDTVNHVVQVAVYTFFRH
ncbi:DUF2490 domain-containing protein [Nevskia sp.]|uniref:DUF2490 domain-containing protein n=1 Tax=Nevskia sp. TaxID=1929292 RepID=UPI0025ECECC4|nr:DUF2490 domain-containing protein [Nevskia sp.]